MFPQGSILGPLFFSLFLNDLPAVLMKSTVILYADDTTVYFCFRIGKIKKVVGLSRGLLWSEHNLDSEGGTYFLQLLTTATDVRYPF